MDKKSLKAFYLKQFEKLYCPENTPTLIQLNRLITPHSSNIVNLLYSTMQAYEQASLYLNTEEVENRLKGSLNTWIEDLLTAKTVAQIEPYIADQLKVGHFHAQLNIPLAFIDYGSRLIKQEINNILIASSLSREELGSALVLVNSLLDHSLGLIDETYMSDLIEHERSAQSLRIHSSSAYLAYECEQLRSSLFDWFRKLLTALSQNKSTTHQLIDITQTDFGLWITHRARLIFTSHSEIDKIEQLMRHAQDLVEKVVDYHNQNGWDQYAAKIDELSETVSEAAWLVDALAKIVLEQESGRDALTHLFNRRYLPNILGYEIEYNIKQGSQFAVLYVDIDHFKHINDQYGHDRGDMVLTEIADLLLKSVRAGDYVFRYGGEEFLIVLTNTTAVHAKDIAEKIRALVEDHPIMSVPDVKIPVTVSIGIALTGNNRNYETTISTADKALYQAKDLGRNRCILAEE